MSTRFKPFAHSTIVAINQPPITLAQVIDSNSEYFLIVDQLHFRFIQSQRSNPAKFGSHSHTLQVSIVTLFNLNLIQPAS